MMRRRVGAFLIVRYVSMLSAHALCFHAFMHRIIRADDEDGYRVTYSFSKLSRVEEVSVPGSHELCMRARSEIIVRRIFHSRRNHKNT